MSKVKIGDIQHQAVMTVKDLKKLLNDFPDKYLVVLAKDGEGNDFSPLAEGYSDAEYIPDSTWSGTIVCPGDEDADEQKPAPNCLVLWPVN